MEQSPSEASRYSASQEIPVIYGTRRLVRVHTIPPLVPILSQMNPVPTFPLNFPKTHPNIIFPPTSRSSQWFFRLKICMHF